MEKGQRMSLRMAKIACAGATALLAALLMGVWAYPAWADPAWTNQGSAKPAQRANSSGGAGQAQGNSQAAPPGKTEAQPDTRLTPQQANELFQSVSEILTFASNDTKLPIEHEVKRRLISRDQVQKYILDKLRTDKDAKRTEREEVVLKKFGLLDRDFHLQPFMVSLLTEQIAGFYDNKTKTVNLLDWVPVDDQKPVMAHELTHALQDQHTDLDKWEPDTPDKMSKTVREDNQRIAVDEQDTARDAVLEGQAMAVYVDYALKSQGNASNAAPSDDSQNTIGISPDEDSSDSSDIDASSSPVMARAPKLLQQSLLFPYKEGFKFEQTLVQDKGRQYAFAGVLDHPPSSSYEIMNPRAFERGRPVPLLQLPDLHPLLDSEYTPYDIGVMGELDVRILVGIFADDDQAAALAPEWNGGIYYAVQRKSAKSAAEKDSTASISLLYLSAWKSETAAQVFAKIYAQEISTKYSEAKRDSNDEAGPDEQIYQTNEGPVLIVRQGRQVFVSESFDLDQARKLEFLLMGAQKGAAIEAHTNPLPVFDPALHLSSLMSSCGMMKAALRGPGF